ncbi:AFG1/ZapE family ATPase [Paenibacillus dendritiformis]|uniref:AFG1/ZapE family ATPase n=1 Tax=Paenibacillus dendritiformis TaxID=130049 RepID=UPI000DA89CF6|nr:AFG1/ZapE family ATPase [Paenibacillus dendritiformis]PZM64835.1 hypothetical protein DOE73_14850 [Paenibacillus dendritiformis]
MQSIKEALAENPAWRERLDAVMARYTPEYFREQLPELDELDVTDDMIRRDVLRLLERLKQLEECRGCTGYANCCRTAGKEGMVVSLAVVSDAQGNRHLDALHGMCDPYRDYHQELRWRRLVSLSGKAASDKGYTFDTYPEAQKRQHKKLCAYIYAFAQEHKPGDDGKGVFVYGPPGTGKTHLLLAMVNVLEERRVPVLFVRTDAVFRHMRGMLSRKESLDILIETYCTVQVLVIDEFAQEAGTDFTIDVMFEVVNARFAAGLPTFFTSNYAPDNVYEKAARKYGLEDKVQAIRSRLNQMVKHAHLTGEDGRKKDREIF